MSMAECVLDASAVLALLAKLGDRGVTEAEQRVIRMSLDIEIRSFDESSAWRASSLRGGTKSRGLSIGDRACLALALEEGLPALTTDSAWSALDVGVDVRALR